jgi:hypothetical protein
MVSASKAMLTAETIETARDRFIIILVGFLAFPCEEARLKLRTPACKRGLADCRDASAAVPPYRFGKSRRGFTDATRVARLRDRRRKKNSTRVKQFTRPFMPMR